MPFPDITIPPETDHRKLIDTLQRFFVSAHKYWSKISLVGVVITSGLDAEKPAATGSGNFYWATDTEKMYYDPPT